MRSVVVLPQPDGPSSAKNAPCGISSEIPLDRDRVVEPLDDVLEPDVWCRRRTAHVVVGIGTTSTGIGERCTSLWGTEPRMIPVSGRSLAEPTTIMRASRSAASSSSASAGRFGTSTGSASTPASAASGDSLVDHRPAQLLERALRLLPLVADAAVRRLDRVRDDK